MKSSITPELFESYLNSDICILSDKLVEEIKFLLSGDEHSKALGGFAAMFLSVYLELVLLKPMYGERFTMLKGEQELLRFAQMDEFDEMQKEKESGVGVYR